MGKVPDYFYNQSAVIPYRCEGGELEVLMISSRKRRRWVVPKGVVERNLSARSSATKEALEEAGIEGTVSSEPIGTYRYKKWGGVCRVDVYLMHVEKVRTHWEESYRNRLWLSLQQAVERTDEKALRALIHALPQLVAAATKRQRVAP